MEEELIPFDLPLNSSSIIKVVGVGGGGSNAVNHMYEQGIKDVDFIVCNTDAQALISSPVQVKVQLGETLTEGRGAGNKPDMGKQSAIESINDIIKVLESNTKMVFITAGMGGGTGTGAAPVIAKAAKEMGILTVAIVTIPFRFEGQQRIKQAIEGIKEIQANVDSLLIINNEKLREIYGDLKLSEAFCRADNVLTEAAKGIAEIITVHGYINVDFADVQTVMQNSGVSIMGSGSANGEDRAIRAIQEALTSPLLNNNDIQGAKNILLNITSGVEEISMDEIGDITDYLSTEVATDANIIWGTGIDPELADSVNVTIIATGFEANSIPELYGAEKPKKRVVLKEETPKKEVEAEEDLVFEVKTKSDPEPQIMSEEQFIQKEAPQVVSQKFNLFEDAYPEEEAELEDPMEMETRMNTLWDQTPAAPSPRMSSSTIQQSTQTKSVNQSERDIDTLENIPAYKRKNYNLTEPGSSEDNVSRYTLEDDGDGVSLKKNNSFLHDNID